MNSRTILTLLCACTLVLSALPAQAEDWRAKIDAKFEAWDSEETAGAMVVVLKDGEPIYERAFGMAVIEDGVLIDADTRFNIASISKQFTAACIALLVLEDKVDLDEDIRHYLPYLPEYESVITVRHLVHHTSGIPDVFGSIAKNRIRYRYPYGNEDVLPVIAKSAELKFAPGEEYAYSNSNYILLAEIAQKVTGLTLDDFAQERIFKPLGMTRTRIDDNLHQLAGQRAESYRRNPKGKFRHIERDDYIVGDGNIVTTANDLAKWDANYRTGQVGGEEFLELMKTRGVLNNGESIEYAFGIIIGEHAGRPAIHHSGGWLGFLAQWAHYPEDGISVIILGNHNYLRNFMEVPEFYFADQ